MCISEQNYALLETNNARVEEFGFEIDCVVIGINKVVFRH